MIFLDRIADAIHRNSRDPEELHRRAQMYDEAVDFKKAAVWHRRAARLGDARSQYRLGHMYALGQGVRENWDRAIKWLTKAAEQGHAEAQLSLGIQYFLSSRNDRDRDLAFKWLRRAYDAGIGDAACPLGQCYIRGCGTPRDTDRGIRILERAADNPPELTEFPEDVYEAALILARLYDEGQYVEADEAKAAEWYRRAADAGCDEAETRLREIEEHRGRMRTESADDADRYVPRDHDI